MDMEHLPGMTEINIQVNLKIITLKALVITSGQMEDNMRGPGKTIKCMGEAYSHGQMAENMRENM